MCAAAWVPVSDVAPHTNGVPERAADCHTVSGKLGTAVTYARKKVSLVASAVWLEKYAARLPEGSTATERKCDAISANDSSEEEGGVKESKPGTAARPLGVLRRFCTLLNTT